jgi:hypothetical protein
LKDGWVGRWSPDIPDGSTAMKLTRPTSDTSGAFTYTTNNGGAWTTNASAGIDAVANTKNLSAVGLTGILDYVSHAKCTKPVANTKVHQGYKGLGSVTSSNSSLPKFGALLGESLIGKVITDGANRKYQTVSITEYTFTEFGELSTTSGYVKHSNIGIAAANGIAFKVFDYPVNDNGAGYIHYAATELQHDGTDYGDDGQIHVTSNESTLIDLNNKVVKNVMHRTEQLGWIKNNV